MLLPADQFAEEAFLAEVLVFLSDPEDDQKDFSAENLSGP
jgi:hypothetical protein